MGNIKTLDLPLKTTPATIEDVARLAEVSIATVSRAIHMPEKVAASTRQKIDHAIAVTGYSANAMARSLRLGRSNMILAIAPDISDPNFSPILIGLEKEARANGLGLLIGHTQGDPLRGIEYLKFMNAHQAAGMILFTGYVPSDPNQPAPRLPPSVAVVEPMAHGSIPFVGVDDRLGARKLLELLLAHGHRRIAFIGDSRARLAHHRRRIGFDEGVAAAGLRDSQMVLDSDGTLEGGRAAIERLFLRDDLPTAFLCVNDQTAAGVMMGLTARGYDVPKDFSVTGFDDIPQANFLSPGLTTIRQPRTAIGQEAMALLLRMLEGEGAEQPETLLMPDLIVRGTVGPPAPWPLNRKGFAKGS
ncbi:LacI family DNA-binding transcriptional regulator [Neogemmobacter tilapiae]|uniref:LacI family transcriptional regulator n=1 Tax=Neogemmobacter tilapiae TaxID=875041 RepID=A0A918WPJ8_9RHOB|nr:LacI family DNA-binding transcriptional regulator [Gemmobacter tilapiae]GHC65268.1 LacI family transcriptional regulator [Gemmobacter tilapiae]